MLWECLLCNECAEPSYSEVEEQACLILWLKRDKLCEWSIIRMFMVPPWCTLSMFSACSIPINAGSTNAVRNFQVWCILAALLRMIWKAQQYRTRRRCVNRFLTLSFPVTTASSHTSDLPFIQAIFRSVGLYPLCFGPLDLSRALIYVSVSGSMVFLTS